MDAFKIVVTVFLAIMIALCGYIVARAGEDKQSVYVGIGISVIEILAIAAIWL